MITVLEGTVRIRQWLKKRLIAGISLKAFAPSSMVSPCGFCRLLNGPCWRTFYYISPGIASTNGARLQPIRTQSHEPGGQAHRHSHRKRQLLAPQRGRLGAMLHFIVRHSFEYGTAPRVGRSQTFHMAP